jgi:tetratricopeptide (TPR) repeat protein
LIREQLAAMGLEGEKWPVPSPDGIVSSEPLKVTVDLGELGARAESQRRARQARTHHELAYAHFESKRWPQAISAYKRAIELSPITASYHNNFAWLLATCSDPKYRDEWAAVEHAQKAVELDPNMSVAWNTFGVARYRVGRWQSAIDALMKAEALTPDTYFAHNAFFLAMSHWQLGDRATARDWFDRAVAWCEKNSPNDEELLRFRAEAVELISREH